MELLTRRCLRKRKGKQSTCHGSQREEPSSESKVITERLADGAEFKPHIWPMGSTGESVLSPVSEQRGSSQTTKWFPWVKRRGDQPWKCFLKTEVKKRVGEGTVKLRKGCGNRSPRWRVCLQSAKNQGHLCQGNGWGERGQHGEPAALDTW